MDHRLKSLLVVLTLVLAAGFIGLVAGNGGITGGAITNTIACYEHKDCNDNIQATEDICKNPGTLNSLCINKPTN
ncbi:hypothetical protein HYT52_03890 [Candidatus Woesearchaeota archaeon]|nr:hypothetical protein [Candidatus Woesearchaeota archaeon]